MPTGTGRRNASRTKALVLSMGRPSGTASGTDSGSVNGSWVAKAVASVGP